jgi:hypothetical protein
MHGAKRLTFETVTFFCVYPVHEGKNRINSENCRYTSNTPHVCVSVHLYVLHTHTHTHTHTYIHTHTNNANLLVCVSTDVACQVYLAVGWRPQCVCSDIYKSYDVLKNFPMISGKHLCIQHVYPPTLTLNFIHGTLTMLCNVLNQSESDVWSCLVL